MDFEIFKLAAERAEPCVLVTILAVKGSAPRHPGAKMLVRSRSDFIGTIGGGTAEARALEAAETAFASRRSSVIKVEMPGMEAGGKEKVCGGITRMLVEYIDDPEPFRAACGLLSAGRCALFIKKIGCNPEGGPSAVKTAVLDENLTVVFGLAERSCDKEAALVLRCGSAMFDEGEGLFFDPAFPLEKLLVLGAGHVGRALAAAALPLGFSITVADDRNEFLSKDFFPPGVCLWHSSYSDIFGKYAFDLATYVVILTRSHVFDLECVRAVLGKRYRYVGLIGSAGKTGMILRQAISDGFDPQKVESLCAPIGLDIGAETPAEIAVAILAEIVAFRRNAPILAAMAEDRNRRRS